MENVDNLILEHLRALRADSAGIREDIQEIKQRLTGLEVANGGIKRDLGDLYTENASQHIRYDRLAARIEKIERRLEVNLR
jgi:regulator of replication initiation timing